MAWGMVVPVMGTVTRCFMAASLALRMASGTSLALPMAAPTWPFSLPTTTSAAKRGVEDVVAVGRRDDEDAGIGFEAIHFDEQLVQGLLAFIVAAA